MADIINEQITDSVTQANTKVLAESPAMAIGSLYTAMGQALSNMACNSCLAQQQAAITMQAATIQGVRSIMATGTCMLGRSAAETK